MSSNSSTTPGSEKDGVSAESDVTADVFADLALLPRWLTWRFEEQAGKKLKLPVNPHTGKPAKTNDPKTWGTLEQARARAAQGLDGVGIMAGLGIVCCDLDACRDPDSGELADWAREIIEGWATYGEISPSGTGVKMFARSDPSDELDNRKRAMSGEPIGGKTPQIELFADKQYLTVTGNHLAGTPRELRTVSTALWQQTAPQEEKGQPTGRMPVQLERLRDALSHIPANDRASWCKVGMALKLAEEDGSLDEEAGWTLWEEWSRTCPDKYDEKACRTQWRSFRRIEGEVVKLGTVFHLAQQHGWPGYVIGTVGPRPLGCLPDGNFALFDQSRQIILSCAPEKLVTTARLMSFASLDYWQQQFPGEKTLINTYAAGDAIMSACRREGPFNPNTVRGRGVWREGDRIIINLGDPVPDDAEYRYICFQPLVLGSSRGEIDTRSFLDWLQLFRWRRPLDAVLALGWYAYAPICGAVNWRPHVFIHAPAGTGKTTIHNTGRQLLSPLVVSADGASTEAGIRQRLGPDSLPVTMDEFESDHDPRRLQGIMKLMRSASSAQDSVLRGTPEGKALSFTICTTFLFSAINPVGGSEADDSRLVKLELLRHDDNPVTARKIEEGRQRFYSQGPAWCRRAIDCVPFLVPTIDVLKLNMPGLNERHRKNMATLLAGAWVMLEGRVPTDEEAAAWVEMHTSLLEAHGEAHQRDDAAECLEHLLSHRVRTDLGAETTLRELIAVSFGSKSQIMEGTDLRLGSDGLLLRNGSSFINKIYAGTKWRDGAWRTALEKLSGAAAIKQPTRFGSAGKQRGLAVPLRHLWGDEEPEDPGY